MGVTLPVVESSQLKSFYPTTYAAYQPFLTGALGLASKVMQRLLAYQALHTMPFERLAELPAGRLLDVGCGGGELGSWLVRRGWTVVGVEPSVEACVVARNRGVDARAGVLAEVELEPGAYDAVVFHHSLEHVADPVSDLRRARETLRDGGIVIVTLPNFGCWQRSRFGEHWFNLELPRHRYHFNSHSLRETLTQAGFAHIETLTTSSAIGLPASIQYALAGRCLFPAGLKLRIAVAACSLTTPVSWLINRLAGGGDMLHAVAARQATRATPPART
jgi:SAM-dependent methyltransferase